MQPPTDEEQRAISHHFFDKEGEYRAFLKLYDSLSSNDFIIRLDQIGQTKPLSHFHVLDIALHLTRNIQSTLAQALTDLKSETDLKFVADHEIKHAVNLAVHCLLMVDSEARNRHATGYILGGTQPTLWLENTTFLNFVENTFPKEGKGAVAFHLSLEKQAVLKARKLKKRLGLRLVASDNLADHLLRDGNDPYVFHHVSFLKGQIEAFRGERSPLDTYEFAGSLSRSEAPYYTVDIIMETNTFVSIGESYHRNCWLKHYIRFKTSCFRLQTTAQLIYWKI